MHFYLLLVFMVLASTAQAAAPIGRCAPDTPESREAFNALGALGQKIEALPPDGSLQPLMTQLQALMQTRCFLIAQDESVNEFSSALALTTWWHDGGKEWLYATLSATREFVMPPSARATLALDGKPGQPLATILCRLDDPLCGRETGGWVERVAAALAVAAERQRTGRAAIKTNPHDPIDSLPHVDADCVERASRVRAAWRYRDWKFCAKFLREGDEALPLGRVRAPTRGYFVIRGRRGHYSFCDEIRAYDLATGAAYVAQSCTGLALRSNGNVDGKRTDAGRQLQLLTGRLPVDNLREAVWLTLLLDKVERKINVHERRVALPPGIEPVLARDDGPFSGYGGGGGTGSSGHTRLDWQWLDGERVLARGEVTWPDCDSAAASHAMELLRIAEAGLQPGCPPSALPPVRLLGGEPPGVNRRDAPAGVGSVHGALWELLDKAPHCTAPPVK